MVGIPVLLAVQAGAIAPAGAPSRPSSGKVAGAPTTVTAVGVDAAFDVPLTAPGSGGVFRSPVISFAPAVAAQSDRGDVVHYQRIDRRTRILGPDTDQERGGLEPPFAGRERGAVGPAQLCVDRPSRKPAGLHPAQCQPDLREPGQCQPWRRRTGDHEPDRRRPRRRRTGRCLPRLRQPVRGCHVGSRPDGTSRAPNARCPVRSGSPGTTLG